MTSPSVMHEAGPGTIRGMGWGGRWEERLGGGSLCTPVTSSISMYNQNHQDILK